jgi:uncharacterized protein (TIRG00374 family)
VGIKLDFKQSLNILVKVSIAAALMYYLVNAGHLDVSKVWALATVTNVIVALLLVGVNLSLCAWRWVFLLRSCGITVSLGYGISLYLIGTFFNHALPGAVGGDMVRGYYLVADFPSQRLDAAISILIDRLLGLYSFFLMSLVAVLWDFEFVMSHEKIRVVAAFCLLVFFAMTTVFLIAFSKRLSRAVGLLWLQGKIKVVNQIVSGFQKFGQDRRAILISVLASILAQSTTVLFFYFLGLAVNEAGVTLQCLLFVVPMGFLVTALPISPAGVGVGQVAFLYLFQTYLQNPSSQFGALAVTAFQLTTVVWAIVGAGFYLKRRKPNDIGAMMKTAETA